MPSEMWGEEGRKRKGLKKEREARICVRTMAATYFWWANASAKLYICISLWDDLLFSIRLAHWPN